MLCLVDLCHGITTGGVGACLDYNFNLCDNSQEFLTAFEDAYVAFALNATRSSFRDPSLPVLVVLSPFNNTLLAGSLQVIAARLTAAGAVAHYLEALPAGDPDGCAGHPGTTWHQEMAQLLAPQISAALGW